MSRTAPCLALLFPIKGGRKAECCQRYPATLLHFVGCPPSCSTSRRSGVISTAAVAFSISSDSALFTVRLVVACPSEATIGKICIGRVLTSEGFASSGIYPRSISLRAIHVRHLLLIQITVLILNLLILDTHSSIH